MDNYFKELNNINVSEKIEKKNGLSYLSWAWAWAELKKIHPTAQYKIYETENGCIYFTDGKTCWVKTGVTVNEIEHIEYLPVMDFRNKSISLETIASTDVNKAIQRSLTKAVARHGLGLYIYAGEDLPEEETQAEAKPVKRQRESIKEDYKNQAIEEEAVSFAAWTNKERLMRFIKTEPKDSEPINMIKDIINAEFGGKKSSELTEEEAKNILDRL